MLKYTYKVVDGQLQDCPGDQAVVFIYVSPDEAERRELVDKLKIDEHTLASSMDPDELSRLEIEPDHIAAIMKRPKHYSAKDNFLFKISSIGLFLFKEKLVVVMAEDAIIVDKGRAFMKMHGPADVFLRILYRAIFHFLEHLRIVNQLTDEIESQISAAMENKLLLHLFALEKSLVYYLNAIHSNSTLIEKLKAVGLRSGFTPEQMESLDDLMIENNQCYKQAEIYSNILSGMMDARASIVNNNLNVLIKRLTIISVVFMPLNIIASIGGMSEFSAWTRGVHWAVSYALFTVGLGGVAWFTYLMLQYTGGDSDASKKRKKLSEFVRRLMRKHPPTA
ncbi:MAG: magnesium transporter CorA family protein [Kiritimatiellia bacterium]